jgi:hypothetical protein
MRMVSPQVALAFRGRRADGCRARVRALAMPTHGDHAPRALWPRSSRHGPPAWADMLATVAMGHSAARLNSNIFQFPIGNQIKFEFNPEISSNSFKFCSNCEI